MSFRKKQLDPEHLQYVGLMFKWFMEQYSMKRADIEILMYLKPIRIFTMKDFKEGQLHYSWDKKRLQRLKREGWIKKTDYKANRKLGEHEKYMLTKEAELMINRFCRILDGSEQFPLSTRNKLKGSDRYSHKVLLTAIKNKKENG